MSETLADHGYVPEEHAPDPLVSHGDPTPPGKVAIWLFLASEVMFFVGILGTYIIFRSGSPELFAAHAKALSKSLAGLNTLVLIFSSLTMALAVDASQNGKRGKTVLCLCLTFLMACGFMIIKSIEYSNKWHHHTVVALDSADKKVYVYDGHVEESDDQMLKLKGFRMQMPEHGNFDIHLASEESVAEGAHAAAAAAEMHHSEVEKVVTPVEGTEYTIPRLAISQDINYFPWKNLFYACYFTLTGIHGIHVLGGMIPIAILAIQAARGKLLPHHTEYIGLYWHFVDLVWIFLFPLLYLI